jgi:hypothetical protein
MPSDPRVTRALALFTAAVEQYRSALATTLEEIRGQLEAGRSDEDGRARRLQAQFGTFGGGRIDAARLSLVLGDRQVLEAAALRRLERASDVLRNLLSRGDGLFHVEVGPGGDLAACVRRHLGQVGRAFAAARIARSAQAGAPSGLDEVKAVESFPFSEWSGAERKLAPPLIVSLAGTDLVAGALAPFLDGAQKILLLVDGFCAPAPLVRLVTPGVMVVQGHELTDLTGLVPWAGTGVGALVPIWAARFAHDPSAGRQPWQRLSVQVSREWRIKRIGGFSPEQQLDELQQLELLAAAPAAAAAMPAAAAAPASVAAVDPAERLATWLLQHANLAGVAATD